MARHLAALGHRLLVHDVDSRSVQSVVECGGEPRSSAKAIASEADLVFTCLPSLDALRDVVLGSEGLQAGQAMKTFVDFSTTGASFAREMAAALRPRGIVMLDAPITGNVVTAGNGKLGIMCSGPQAAFDRAEPVLRDLASAIVLYLGDEVGRAQRLKLLNNLLSATGMAASCEAFILGVKAGLDPEVMLEVVNSGDANSSATRNKFAQCVLPRRFDFGARMAITAKDTALTVKEAEELGVPMWIAQSVAQIWKYAVSQGGADKDGTALITYLEPWAGIEVRARSDVRSPHADPAPMRKDAEHIVVCEAPLATALARRLREASWSVAMADEETLTRTPIDRYRRCTVVRVNANATAAELLRLLQPADSPRIIVNACPMPMHRADELARALTDRGEACVDALPVATMRGDATGVATIVASGPAHAFAQAKPLLQAMGSRVFHVSENAGAAQLMQQIDGSLFAILLAATCESYVTGAKAGLGPLTMTKILGIETGRNAASARIIPQEVATRTFDYGKTIEQACRELTLASDEARRLGATTWILDKARLLYGLAAQLGSPDDDVTGLVTHYEAWANVEVTAGAASPIAFAHHAL